MAKNDKPTLWTYAGKNKYLTAAALVLSGISAVLALMPFVFIWRMLDELFKALPDLAQAQNIALNGWLALAFAAASVLTYLAALMCSHISAFNTAASIRKKTLAHVLTLPVGTISRIGTGKMRRTIDESSAATENYMAHMLPDWVGAVVTPVSMLVLLFIFDWRLGLICLIPVAAAFSLMMGMTGKRMVNSMNLYQNALADMNNQAVEYVRGVPVVKTFQQSVFSFKKFKQSIDNYKEWVIAYTKRLRTPMIFYSTLINSIFAFLVPAALIFSYTEADLGAFLVNLLFYIIFTPIIVVTLTKIMYAQENNMITKDAINRINGVMELSPLSEVAEPKTPSDNSVEFKNVDFAYEGALNNAVSGLNFYIPSGATAAFVGPSGGGKTTVAGLISRFWDVGGGEILVGGVNVKEMSKTELSNTIAYVFQDSRLIKTSILENVRLARPSASREEVLNACKAACCDDIIAKLPNGIDTVIGKDGVFLSGGEMQRVTIARAVLKNAPIVVLDEATAFADPENEHMVQKAFSNLKAGKTVIMIAHRLTTVAGADEIFVLKDGKLCERGKHEQLLGKNGVYSDMWREYQKSVSWKIAKAYPVQPQIGTTAVTPKEA
jgi:ATP-binding cassette subfamily B protein